MRDDCIEWLGYKEPSGYGRRKFNGVPKLAHRVAFAVASGVDISLLDGLHILHKCDNPGCVNDHHLFIGKHKDNMQDKARKGRSKLLGLRKLSKEQVEYIREHCVKGKPNSFDPHSQSSLARRFGVSQAVVRHAYLGDTYSSTV